MPPPPARKTSIARRLFRVLQLVVVGGGLVISWPTSMGGQISYVHVSGKSMEPTYRSGDLVVTREQASYRVADPIVYRVPKNDIGAGAQVVHRIVGGDGRIGFDMQGDNNNFRDTWKPRQGDVVGRVVVHVPGGGRWLGYLAQPINLGILCGSLTIVSMLWPRSGSTSGKDRVERGARSGIPAQRRGRHARRSERVRRPRWGVSIFSRRAAPTAVPGAVPVPSSPAVAVCTSREEQADQPVVVPHDDVATETATHVVPARRVASTTVSERVDPNGAEAAAELPDGKPATTDRLVVARRLPPAPIQDARFNAPLHLVARGPVPSLALGGPLYAESRPRTGLETAVLANILARAGLPAGVEPVLTLSDEDDESLALGRRLTVVSFEEAGPLRFGIRVPVPRALRTTVSHDVFVPPVDDEALRHLEAWMNDAHHADHVHSFARESHR